MLLKKLREYADEIPPLYERTPVAWVVTIDSNGRPLAPKPGSRINSETTRGKRVMDMTAPVVQRSSGVRPLLLADKSGYTFGLATDADRQNRADKEHAAYRGLLDRCATTTGEPAVTAVQRFYERGGVSLLDLGEDWNVELKVAFEVVFPDGTRQNPINLPSVQRFWLSVNEPDPEGVGHCLVCGEKKPVLDRLPTKAKGIPGGHPSGTALISANRNAFESYGLRASRTSPTCLDCGMAVMSAINHLLGGEDTHLSVNSSAFIFWTRHPVEGFDFASLMSRPDPATVREFLGSVRSGRRVLLEDGTDFYAAVLSANRGRAVVRDWIDTTVGRVRQNVADWFAMQRITNPRDEDPTGLTPRPLGLYALAVSTVRRADDIPPGTNRALFRASLSGTPLPMEIAFQVVRRNRAARKVTHARASLVKLVLLSNERSRKDKDHMVALNPEHPDTAYHCGRLLAELERVQYAALGKVNSTVVDRYYGAASSKPALVFGQLLGGAEPHLAKLADGRRAGLRTSLTEVCARIADFPKTLTLQQQAIFSLGFYHQKAHNRAAALSRRAAKEI